MQNGSITLRKLSEGWCVLESVSNWTAEDFKVSQTMQEYFANFIKTGNPNGDDLPEWPSAEAGDDTPPVMVIDTESKAIESQKEDRYEFLDKFYGNNK